MRELIQISFGATIKFISNNFKWIMSRFIDDIEEKILYSSTRRLFIKRRPENGVGYTLLVVFSNSKDHCGDH